MTNVGHGSVHEFISQAHKRLTPYRIAVHVNRINVLLNCDLLGFVPLHSTQFSAKYVFGS